MFSGHFTCSYEHSQLRFSIVTQNALADHAEAMANFAIEMLETMKQFHSVSTGEEIQLRIGIRSGEVVTGVIGKKNLLMIYGEML